MTRAPPPPTESEDDEIGSTPLICRKRMTDGFNLLQYSTLLRCTSIFFFRQNKVEKPRKRHQKTTNSITYAPIAFWENCFGCRLKFQLKFDFILNEGFYMEHFHSVWALKSILIKILGPVETYQIYCIRKRPKGKTV